MNARPLLTDSQSPIRSQCQRREAARDDAKGLPTDHSRGFARGLSPDLSPQSRLKPAGSRPAPSSPAVLSC